MNHMRPEVEALYRKLDLDMGWLFHKWGEFQELYAKGEERIDLLNSTASNFFYFNHQLMFENMMLHLSRLTDPAQTRSQINLTLESLIEALDDTEAELKGKLRTAIDKVQHACKFARKWRHKRIAHTDRHISTLPSVNAEDLKNALAAVRDFMNCVEEYYSLPRSVFANDPWGAKSLVHFLKVAVRAQEDERRRWQPQPPIAL
jgi:hypothetical protein